MLANNDAAFGLAYACIMLNVSNNDEKMIIYSVQVSDHLTISIC